jgi:hypothetical protein
LNRTSGAEAEAGADAGSTAGPEAALIGSASDTGTRQGLPPDPSPRSSSWHLGAPHQQSPDSKPSASSDDPSQRALDDCRPGSSPRTPSVVGPRPADRTSAARRLRRQIHLLTHDPPSIISVFSHTAPPAAVHRHLHPSVVVGRLPLPAASSAAPPVASLRSATASFSWSVAGCCRSRPAGSHRRLPVCRDQVQAPWPRPPVGCPKAHPYALPPLSIVHPDRCRSSVRNLPAHRLNRVVRAAVGVTPTLPRTSVDSTRPSSWCWVHALDDDLVGGLGAVSGHHQRRPRQPIAHRGAGSSVVNRTVTALFVASSSPGDRGPRSSAPCRS